MKIKTSSYVIFLIFALTLALRLYLVLSAPNLSDENAYFHLRHINNIIEDKKIIYYDFLSYGGRYVLQPPLFHIIMALLSFGNIFLLKILPELFFSLLVVLVYLMAKDVSEDENSALFAALLSGFVPIFLEKTLNVISSYSLALPLLFLMFYCLLKLDQIFYRNIFIVCVFLLPLIHPIAILFIISIIFYFLILSGGAVTATKLKKEGILLAVLTIIFIEFIIYKKAFLSYGLNTIWQNIPVNILEDAYKKFSVSDLLVGVGVLPLVLGSIGVYIGMGEKKKPVYLYSSFILTVLILLVLRLLSISTGLMILGISLCIFSALTIAKATNYIKKTRFYRFNYIIVIGLIAAFIIFSLVPSFGNGKISFVSNDKLNDMRWILENTNENDVIVGNLLEGHLITGLANRKNIVDANFLLSPNPIKRLKDVDLLYTTFTEAKALEIIRRYNIKIIYLSEDTEKIYEIKDLNFVKGSKCFDWRENFYVFKC